MASSTYLLVLVQGHIAQELLIELECDRRDGVAASLLAWFGDRPWNTPTWLSIPSRIGSTA